MRQEFSQFIEEYGRRETRLVFLTGDLGFMALEGVRAVLGPRFVNMGVSEQNMVAVAAGLARQGLRPLCYSIAPFAAFRPFEQIRLDVALHNLPVKIVGNGGGYGYGIMGATHHAIEDLATLSCLQNFACIVPLCGADVAGASAVFFEQDGPGYLRLGLGAWPAALGLLPVFQPVRRLMSGRGSTPKLTIVGLGPVLLALLPWLFEQGDTDVFVISQLPLPGLDQDLRRSVAASGRLLAIEEHVARGGMGEHLASQLAQAGVNFTMHHRAAAGYPTGHYGSQAFHQAQSGLDAASLREMVGRLIN